MTPDNVMIAGIGGASLGTEIAKCLHLAGCYHVFGCDIAPHAYGLYDSNFTKTFLVRDNAYIDDVVEVCNESGCRCIIPGGEMPNKLLSDARSALAENGIALIGNSPEVVDICSDKSKTFVSLAKLGIHIPMTKTISSAACFDDFRMPCIIKPATCSGGSVFTFYAKDVDEAWKYSLYILNQQGVPIAQEYVPVDDGEYTVGVLNLPDKTLVGSIVLKRDFSAKLSVSVKKESVLVSSGYSQGYIGPFPQISLQAESIAQQLGSMGPMNVQGRILNGEFVPFEINPRFSASTYLRTMAGFNEIHIFLQYVLHGSLLTPAPLISGWYLRSLCETFIPNDMVKK